MYVCMYACMCMLYSSTVAGSSRNKSRKASVYVCMCVYVSTTIDGSSRNKNGKTVTCVFMRVLSLTNCWLVQEQELQDRNVHVYVRMDMRIVCLHAALGNMLQTHTHTHTHKHHTGALHTWDPLLSLHAMLVHKHSPHTHTHTHTREVYALWAR